MSAAVMRNKVMTPDFTSSDVVLFKWAQGAG